MTVTPTPPEPVDDVDADQKGEPDDDVREALAEDDADSEGGEVA
jgi:hypothetical protein